MRQTKVTGSWKVFPPDSADAARLDGYSRMEKLYKTDHSEIFSRAEAFVIAHSPHAGMYIPVNMCALIANKQADFLFGEDLDFKSPSDDAESESAMAAIIDRSRLMTELRTGEINCSCMGGTVLKVRYSDGGDGEERGAYIETMPVSCFFPQIHASNARRMEAAAMAYVYEEPDESGKAAKRLYKEIHEPGRVTARVYEMAGNSVGALLEESSEETGYPGLLLFYAPNNRFGGDFWGQSDFKAIEGLQNELNFAVSQLGLSMNKYSEPLLVVPSGTMRTAAETERARSRLPLHPFEFPARVLRMAWAKINPNAKVFPVEAKVVEGDPDALGNLPRYEQPSADFASRLSQIEKLQNLMMAVSETNASALGLEGTGLPESGRALRIRMAGPLAKIKRKMQFWHPVIVEAMYAARTLEYVRGMGPEPERPVVIWPDGLPEDEREQVEIAATMKNAGLASRRTAVAKAQQLEGEALTREIEAIEEDDAAARDSFVSASAASLTRDGEGEGDGG